MIGSQLPANSEISNSRCAYYVVPIGQNQEKVFALIRPSVVVEAACMRYIEPL